MHVRATGDVHIDDHHTNEDIALAIGTVSVAIFFSAFLSALMSYEQPYVVFS